MNLNYKKQQGFSILAIILFIVVILIAIGVWIFSGTVNTNMLNTNKLEIEAAAIIADANAIKNVYTNFTYSGADSSQITFMPNQGSSLSSYNILDTKRGINRPVLQLINIRGQLLAPESLWVFNNTGFSGMNVGTITSDPVILLAGLSDDTCRIINTKLYGVTTIPKVSSILTAENWVSNATLNNPNSNKVINLNSLSISPSPNGWTSGCLSSQNFNQNVFFYILKIN